MRNKWKRNHDDKVNKVLGMNRNAATSRLERMMIFHAYKKLGLGNCYQCGFPIESYKDMSIEHKKPYGGNEAKGIEADPTLFWDLDNVCLSHQWCNCSAGCGGSGKYKYIGIHDFIDNRKTPAYKYVRAEITINSKSRVLGYYKTQEEAAIAYDIGTMVFRKGVGKLNFENFREDYKKVLEIHDTDDPRFFYVRNGKIKEIVQHFHSMINSPTP